MAGLRSRDYAFGVNRPPFPFGAREPTWQSRWQRRLVTVPPLLFLTVTAVLTSPCLLAVALLSDALSSERARLARTRATLFVLWLLLCESIGVLAATLLWLRFALRASERHRAFESDNASLQRRWTKAIFGAAVTLFRLRVEVEGETEAEKAPFLLFVRHVSTADTVIAAALIASPRRLVLRYVLKRELAWDPCLDIVGHRLPNVFVDRSGRDRDGELARIAELTEDLDDRSAVLIYPEGTRYSKAKHAAAVARITQSSDANKASLADIASRYRHVMPPKLGGPLALIAAAPNLDVVFLEHTGFEDVTSLRQIWRGALVGRTLTVRLRRVTASSIPAEGRDVWLYREWLTMDDWIDGMRNEAR